MPFLDPLYGVRWENLDTGDAASGSRQFVSILDQRVAWSSYKVLPAYAQVYLTGIPLRMGSNEIQVTAGGFNSPGNARLTVTRVMDITPPVVHSVFPEPGGTGSIIAVYVEEQLDPASVSSAFLVVDNNGQPAPGVSEFDPLELTVSWRPQPSLNPATNYTAQVSGFTDLAGNLMASPFQWSFVTPP